MRRSEEEEEEGDPRGQHGWTRQVKFPDSTAAEYSLRKTCPQGSLDPGVSCNHKSFSKSIPLLLRVSLEDTVVNQGVTSPTGGMSSASGSFCVLVQDRVTGEQTGHPEKHREGEQQRAPIGAS